MTKRWLIVNADDLGLSPDTNRGIFHAHENGIVTSASLMVRAAAAADAVRNSREFPNLSIGLHVDLGGWTYRDGRWAELYSVVPRDDLAAVKTEIGQQLESFRQLLGRDPTHIDSHQHVHRDKPLRPIFREIASRLGLPLRACQKRVAFLGGFYGRMKTSDFPEGISVANLCRIIHELGAGVTELSCHPSFDRRLNSDYRAERLEEVRTLCDPAVREQLEREQVALISFAELPVRP